MINRVGHGWAVHFKEETILMLGLKQLEVLEIEGNMYKGNKGLQKTRWHGQEKKVFGEENKSQIIEILA